MSPSSSTTALSSASTTHLPTLTPSTSVSTNATSNNSPPHRPQSQTSSFTSPLALAQEQHRLNRQCLNAALSEPNLAPPRPSFHSSLSSDPVREYSYTTDPPQGAQPARMMMTESHNRKPRQSIFKELDMDDPSPVSPSLAPFQLPDGSVSPTHFLFDDQNGRSPGTTSHLAIPRTNPQHPIVSAPVSPTEPNIPKKSLSVRAIGSRAISFTVPPRANTSGARSPGDRSPSGGEGEVVATKSRKRWFAVGLSRPKIKTASSAPPPTLKTLSEGGGSPTWRR